jgi:hypothetical protein
MPLTSFVESQDIAQPLLFEKTPNNATNRTFRGLLRPSNTHQEPPARSFSVGKGTACI